MQEEEQVRLAIPTVNTKIERLFDNDPHSDIKVVYNNEASYNLNRSYLRVDSDFFKERMDPQHSRGGQLDITANFRTADFEKVLKCLYGAKFMVPKSEALMFWSIAKFLKVDKLATRLKEVIMGSLQQYHFFTLLALANEYGDSDIFDSCMKVLDSCGYSRLKSEREQLNKLPADLFKCLIIHHNKFRKKQGNTALSYLDINQLIQGYCGENQKQYRQLKSELLSPQDLSSEEYKLLYHKDLVQLNSNRVRPPNTMNALAASGMESTTILRNTSLSQTTSDFVISSENFMNQKRIAELSEENQRLKRFVERVESQMSQSMIAKEQFDTQLVQLRKADQLRQSALQTVEQRLAKLETEMQRKDELLKKQESTIGELRSEIQTIKNVHNQSLNFSTSKPHQEEEDILVTSKVLPGDYFKDIFKPQEVKVDSTKASTKTATPSHSKSEPKDKGRSVSKDSPHKKSPAILHSPSYSDDRHPPKSPIRQQIEQPPEEQIEGGDRLEFSCQPTTITKQMYIHLMEVLEIDSFKKTQLELLFRATKGRDNLAQFLKSVSHSQNLLFLIHIWESDKIIGAYTSAPIEGEGMLSDPNAYIFSVTGCKKFACKQSKCIQIGGSYLIKFGRDLMIHKSCLDEESDCEWPTTFQGDSSLKNPVQWLTGDRHFQIENLEVYQLIEQQIEMVM